MIDTHCHIQYEKYDSDRSDVISRTLEAGIKMICVGTDLEMSQKAVELSNKYDGIWSAVGLHPNDNLEEKFDPEPYKQLAKGPKVVAIGEIGLDYYRTPDTEQQKTQKQRFLEQIGLALEIGKPAIIHCREAHQDMQDILSENPDLRGVIHSFTGTWEEAKKYVDLGFYIGLNGIITFARDYDEAIINLPLEKILLETDAPFLTPVPHRGQRNEPSYVDFVAQKVSEIKGISAEEVKEVTTQNAIDLFGLK